MIQMIAAASDPRPRLSLEETLDESSWREDFERSQVKPNQSERMFFRRSLFSGVSNLSTPVAALFPSSSVGLVRRAKSGLVGETLPNHSDNQSDNVTGGQGRDVKSVVETKRDTGGVIKNRTGPGSKIQKGQFLPFSHFLTDLHGREHDYLRISISERCKHHVDLDNNGVDHDDDLNDLISLSSSLISLRWQMKCTASKLHPRVERLHRCVFLYYHSHPPSLCYSRAVLDCKLGQNFTNQAQVNGF